LNLLQGKPELLKIKGYGPLPWAFLYEIPFIQLTTLVLIAAAKEEGILAPEATEMTADALVRILERDETDEWSDEECKEAAPFLIALGAAYYRTIKSFFYFGCSLNALVARARSGDDASLLKAIRVDPGVITGPTGAARLNQAALHGEKTFLTALGSAMTRPPKKRKGIYNEIRVVMSIIADAGGKPSDRDLVALFCDELKMYSPAGYPEKGLRKLMREVELPSTTDKCAKWVADAFKAQQ
jgi:hypothetical protein